MTGTAPREYHITLFKILIRIAGGSGNSIQIRIISVCNHLSD